MSVPSLSSLLPGGSEPTPQPTARLAVVEGEGIGPEVVAAAMTVLAAAAKRAGITLDVVAAGPIGSVGPDGFHVDDTAACFYDEVLADGRPVLTGPAGGRFVYELRARYDLFAKLVPVRPMAEIADASIVRPDRIRGVDVLIVRDNVGGLYQGAFGRRDDGRTAFQEACYRADQVERLLGVALAAARHRDGRLAVVTKPGGIPAISALWRECAEGLGADDVTIEVIEVDNACYQLVADPHRFDVVATPNMLGDVVSDTAALVLGSRGMAYSANFREDGRAVYQTGHGAAHDLAGLDRANPVAQIRSLAWLARESLGLTALADAIDDAVTCTLAHGIRTPDISGPESTVVGTRAMADAIVANLSITALEPAAP
jgi:3-isopropylmalate dehydrogenase